MQFPAILGWRSGGLSLENFEISRPENAISCNLRMETLGVYPCNLGIDFFSAYVQQERPFVDFFSAWKPEICQNQGNSRSFFQNQGNSRKIFKFKEIWGNPSDSRSSGQPGCVLDTLCLFFQSKVSSSNDTSQDNRNRTETWILKTTYSVQDCSTFHSFHPRIPGCWDSHCTK